MSDVARDPSLHPSLWEGHPSLRGRIRPSIRPSRSPERRSAGLISDGWDGFGPTFTFALEEEGDRRGRRYEG